MPLKEKKKKKKISNCKMPASLFKLFAANIDAGNSRRIAFDRVSNSFRGEVSDENLKLLIDKSFINQCAPIPNRSIDRSSWRQYFSL